MDRPDQRPSPDESWDDVQLDDEFVVSATFREAPGLERIAKARWSAYKEPLAPRQEIVPVVGVSPRHPHIASRLAGATLAVALLATGGYVALRAPGITSPATTLVMGSDRSATGGPHSGGSDSTQTNAARPGVTAGTYDGEPGTSASNRTSSRNAAPTVPTHGPAALDGAPPAPKPSGDTSALPLSTALAITATGTPTPTVTGSAQPDPSASPDASPTASPSASPTPAPTASPTATPAPAPTPTAAGKTPSARARLASWTHRLAMREAAREPNV